MASLDLALKEWAIVCDLLSMGETALLLRKGGIHEDDGPGRFRLEHDRFALFPAWEHQDPDRIKPQWREQVEVFDAEPAELTVRGWAEVPSGCIWEVPSRVAFDKLDDLHCWTSPQIDMRFGYKPERPLYLMALRAYRLAAPRVIGNRLDYAGCRSWVPLEAGDQIDPAGSAPAMDDAAFEAVLTRVGEAFGA